MASDADISKLKTKIAALESLVIELLEALDRIDPDEADRISAPASGYRLKLNGAKEALPTGGPVRRRRQRLVAAALGPDLSE